VVLNHRLRVTDTHVQFVTEAPQLDDNSFISGFKLIP